LLIIIVVSSKKEVVIGFQGVVGFGFGAIVSIAIYDPIKL
jgi:hypothetical protein